LNVTPVGKLPPEIDQVYPPTPPEAEKVCEKLDPIVTGPAGQLDVITSGGGLSAALTVNPLVSEAISENG
jgi:hypothetical protein